MLNTDTWYSKGCRCRYQFWFYSINPNANVNMNAASRLGHPLAARRPSYSNGEWRKRFSNFAAPSFSAGGIASRKSLSVSTTAESVISRDEERADWRPARVISPLQKVTFTSCGCWTLQYYDARFYHCTGWPITSRTWVGLNLILDVPLSARFGFGWWEIGRMGRAAGLDEWNMQIKVYSTHVPDVMGHPVGNDRTT